MFTKFLQTKTIQTLLIFILNLDYFTTFRKNYLTTIHNEISEGKQAFCCYVDTWQKKYICWKELREVKSNYHSSYIKSWFRGNEDFLTCGVSWFRLKSDRIGFLEECLKKFN